MWKCQSCGNNNSDNANFCSNCGTRKTHSGSVSRKNDKASRIAKSRNILVISVACITALTVLLIFLKNENSIKKPESTLSNLQPSGNLQAPIITINGQSESPESSSNNVEPNSSLRGVVVGDVIYFGRYEQSGSISDGEEEIEWIVLETRSDRVLVISRYILERIVYDSQGGYYAPAWDDSAVCLWLNSAFYQEAFTNEEKSLIETVTVTNEIRDAQNRVFILNAPEARKYFDTDSSRIAEPTRFISSNSNWTAYRAWEFDDYEELSENGRSAWLLRAEGSFADCAAYVDGTGEICEAYGNGLCEAINGIRPAMWIKVSE